MKNFRRKKTYGEYQIPYCPFCNKIATLKNEQGMNVCREHQKQNLGEIKCACGNWLEARSGKFGPYFNCINCGNINYKKGLAMKELIRPNYEDILGKDDTEMPKKEPVKSREIIKIRKEITISSRDAEYFD